MPSGDAPTLVVVDDHPLWRQTLCSVIERGDAGRVVGEAADGETAVRLVEELTPDVVLMDMHLPGMSGAEATVTVLRAHPATRVLVLSSSDDRDTVVAAVRAGASGYLLKTADAHEVYDALRRVHRGEMVFPPALATFVLEELRSSDRAKVPPRLRVAVVAEGVLDREGLARLLAERGFDVAAAGSVEELSDALADVVLAVAPARRDGLLARIRAATTRPVVVVAPDVDAEDALALLADETGGSPVSYLLRDRIDDVDAFADALRRVSQGETVLDSEVAGLLVARRSERDALAQLTAREREVLQLMAEGRSNQAISERLFLSGKSVEANVARIFTKLGLELAPDDHRRVLAVVAYLRATT